MSEFPMVKKRSLHPNFRGGFAFPSPIIQLEIPNTENSKGFYRNTWEGFPGNSFFRSSVRVWGSFVSDR